MKKIFTTLLLAMGICTLTQAQTKNKNEFGISIGLNSAYVTSNAQYGQNPDLIWAPNIAISADHYFSDAVSLKVKAIYDPKGWGNGFITVGTKTLNGVYYTLNYITIPLTFNYHFGNQKTWYANAGPYIGFLLNAKEDYTNSNKKSSFKSTDSGADVGLGAKFPISSKLKLFVEYDGQFGFSNVFANNATGAENMRSSLNIGIKF